MLCTQLTLLCLTAAATTTLGDLPPGTRRNTYLPPEPTKGYDYNKPPGPGFPSPGPPGRPTPGFPVGPPARPTPSFPTGPPARPPPGPPARPSPRPPAPSFPPPGRPTPGGGYPPPGPRPTPGFPDFPGSPSGPGNTVSDVLWDSRLGWRWLCTNSLRVLHDHCISIRVWTWKQNPNTTPPPGESYCNVLFDRHTSDQNICE